MKRRLIHALLCSLLTLFLTGFGQDEEQKPVYELNPFNVDESADVGYSATNTLSGTRFNSSLRDTSASVSVWTQEFINDTGLTEIDELIDYSLNTVLDLNDQDGAGGGFNNLTGGQNVTQRIRTRGVDATRGIDYFKAITPDDSYKIGRYDDARGPNGVLFGVSQAGGLINQTSLVANTYQDTGRVRYSFGTSSRDRAEFRYNKVLVEDKLALVVAGLNQDNGHWRDWAQQDKERIYAAMTWRPTDRITLRANYEDGFEHRTSVQPSPVSDWGLPWYDYSLVTPLEDITFNPYRRNGQGAQVNATTRAVGVGERDGNPRRFAGTGNNRFTYIENDGSFHNLAGNFNTVGYHKVGIVPVDGSPTWPDDSVPNPPRYFRVNDQSILPFHLNPGGPDFYRESDFSSYSFFADFQITDNWFFNLQFGDQEVRIDIPQIQGSRPELRWDPNTVQDAVDPDAAPNPWVGQPYFDGDYRRDTNRSKYEEIRASTSYNLNTEKFGRHRIAIAASEVDETQRRFNTWLALAGNPDEAGTFTDFYGNRYQNSTYHNADNRVTVRNYFDWEDQSTWRAGSLWSVPETLTTDRFEGVPTEYRVVHATEPPGNINFKIRQITESQMAVSQSHFWNDRLVVTLGYRKDKVHIDRAGHYRDLENGTGWIADLDITPDTPSDENTIPGSPPTEFDGTVRTAGAVFHLFDNLSLVANAASNIGIPDFRRTVYPDGATSPPPQGDGVDFGIDFSALDNRISGRLVYYETDSVQEVVGGNDPAVRMERMYTSLETAFDDFGADAALDDLLSRRAELRPEVNGRFRDNVSSGYELRITANITDNWRLSLNAAKTDRIVSNSFSKTVPFIGLTFGEDGRAIQGVTAAGEIPDPEDPDATIIHYEIDPSAYTSDGVISKMLAYESQLPEGQTFDTITDNGTRSFAFSLQEAVDQYNGDIEVFEKRWGLRPYRFNLFTTYDFKEGLLKGWSVGGGYRFTSANIMGEENGVEIDGEEIAIADFLLRYRTGRGAFFGGDGRWTFQLNVNNLFDDRRIIPSRLAIDGNVDYMIPGGRGVAYTRFDLQTPREYRFTVTYDF